MESRTKDPDQTDSLENQSDTGEEQSDMNAKNCLIISLG